LASTTELVLARSLREYLKEETKISICYLLSVKPMTTATLPTVKENPKGVMARIFFGNISEAQYRQLRALGNTHVKN